MEIKSPNVVSEIDLLLSKRCPADIPVFGILVGGESDLSDGIWHGFDVRKDLKTRISEACDAIPFKHLQGFIRHAFETFES
jgi:hypothetical protein